MGRFNLLVNTSKGHARNENQVNTCGYNKSLISAS